MPYSIRKGHHDCPSSRPIAVVKTGDGEKVGCHATEAGAKRQIAAIEANEKGQQ